MNANEELLDEVQRMERATLVTRLISTMAHELGTPLNVIFGRASMIASGEASGTEAIENARLIVEQAGRMTAIIRQMLGNARRGSSERSEVSMRALIEQVFAVLGKRAGARGVELVIDPELEPISLFVDRGRFLLVLKHLIANSIDAMPEGGIISVGVRKESSTPKDDQLRSGNEYFCIYVRDQGIGIPKKDLANIFKPFFKLKDDSDGAGLGLAIVHGIVREHGGWIDVESELGEGSTFKVCLPEGGVNARAHLDRR
jgi:signal transduction histidine kinase